MPPTRRSTRTTPSATASASTSAPSSVQPYPSTRTNKRHDSPTPPKPTGASVASTTTGNKPGLRLTVKAPPSKLRQATSSEAGIPPNPYTDEDAQGGRAVRRTRNKRAVVEAESDEDEDVEGDDDEEMGGEADVDRELLAQDDDDEDEEEDEEEDEDAEGEDDEEMSLNTHPPAPVIKHSISKSGRPNVTVTAPPTNGLLKSVEAKEMDLDGSGSDDEELSELDSADEMDDDETGLGPGEGDEEDVSDDSLNDSASRSATPDLSKLTNRQKGLYVAPELLALSNEAQKKKHLTVEEHAMRRQEMARRRKKLSERKNEDEKELTIQKLLSKPAPKRRSRAEILAAQHAAEAALVGTPRTDGEAGEVEIERIEPVFARYVQDCRGSRLGVPGSWMDAGVFMGAGRVGAAGVGGLSGEGEGQGRGWKMVEEVA
ncbi:hypothetical protein LTR53_004775 [Teratosphaeriaceae sp. CCFEE 6253]|nr:hypothetical protein LTR53_004775 [Teratosphaeriaceae sp. CCFEE 6253]